MTVTLFCPSNGPDIRPRERAPAMAKIVALRATYPLVIWPVREPTDYSRGLAHYWREPEMLINIEHDMAPEPWQVDALAACPEPLCACVYWLAPASTGRRDVILSAKPLGGDPNWALTPAIGLCKIDPIKRRGDGPPPCNYRDVEFWLWRLCGQPWHLHYPPVVHYHGFREEGIGSQQAAVRRYRDESTGRSSADGAAGAIAVATTQPNV